MLPRLAHVTDGASPIADGVSACRRRPGLMCMAGAAGDLVRRSR